ncbi:MAG: hypothetical protein ABIF19_21125 [Planctomycetota bacterium]
MSDRFSATVCLALVVALVIGGCEHKQQKDVDVFNVTPDTATISVPSDYAAAAIKAAGGLDAWSNTKELQLDCVVTFYQPDGSSYLTEQHWDVYPWSNSIRLSGREPQGEFAWQLSKGRFESLQGGDGAGSLPAAMGRRCFADMVLNIVTVPARFLDQSVEFVRHSTPTKLQGRWYYTIDRRSKPDAESVQPSAAAVFYQDRDKAVIDMIRLVCKDGQRFLIVRGYDYTEVEKGGISVPARIEIFNSDAGGNLKDRLVSIDFHALGKTK